MAKRKAPGTVKLSKRSNRQTNLESQVKKKQTKQKEKTSLKVEESKKPSVEDEKSAPADVTENGNGRRSGRRAKLQAVKKMETMQKDIKTTDGNDDEDDVSLDLEYVDDDDDSSEDGDGEDEDDFEATLPKQKGANTRQKISSRGKIKSQDRSQHPEEDLTAEVKQKGKIVEERYLCQASQEQFLSLSESDTSSEDEDIRDSSKIKHSSSVPISVKPKTVMPSDNSKSMEMTKEFTESSPLAPTDSAPKSMFDDLEDIPALEGSQPGQVKGCTQSLFDDVDQESDHGGIKACEEETDAKPVVTSQYFAKCDADDFGSPNHNHLMKGKTLKEKIKVSDARVTVKSTLSDEHKNEESDFEESPPKKAKKPVRKRPTKGGKQAAKINEKTNEKQTKKVDDTKALPATSKKRGRAKSQSTPSDAPIMKTESKGRRGKGGQSHLKKSIESPAKKRKLSSSMKNSSDDTVKKTGRGKTTKIKMETKMEVDEMEVDGKDEDADMSSDDSHSDWEEVEDTPINELGEPTVTPKKETKAEEISLEIDIDLPGTSKAGKKKKREYNWANYFQWQVNKYNKERQLLLHKAHLVLLLASGFHSNNICNKMELQCLALSIIPAEILSKRPKQLNINYLTKILGWFKNSFKIGSDLKEDMMSSLDRILPSMFEKRQAASERELVHMFAIILRCLGADVRLIFSLQPLTFKAKKLTKKFKKENANAPIKKTSSQSSTQEQKKVHPKQSSSRSDVSSSPSKSAHSPSKSSSKSCTSAPKTQSSSSNIKMSPSKSAHKPRKSSFSKSSSGTPETQSTSSKRKISPSKSGPLPTKSSSNKSSASAPKTLSTSSNTKTTSSKAVKGNGKTPSGKDVKEEKTAPKKTPGIVMRCEMRESSIKKERGEKQHIASSGRPNQNRTLRAKNNTRRTVASKMSNIDDDEDEEDDSDDDHSDYEEELRKSASKRKSRMPSTKGSSKKKTKMASSVSSMEEVSSDSDFEVKVMSITKRPPKTETQKDGPKKKASRKILSSDSSEESVMLVDVLDPGSDCWLEVYLSSEKRWLCVDCVRTVINKPEMCEKQATKPITYVIGVENDGCVKDVTRRYASKWMTETHKLRPVDEWWEETLRPYRSNKERDRKEDSDVQSNLTSKPLPTSVAEYKNHPLYALKRHLLKFEALYPESAAILGYCKGEAVYSRECVHTLHTRETWMKEGKAIRIGEKPYKMVKPRPKWKRGEGMIKTEEAILGIFGVWQIEDYIPPPAVDGKVPRNEYGNVELFKPTMLPAGTVHLKIPGLNKIARKLDIDCAPAMMGWDFHSGYIHPVMDGFVVCEEHVDVLVAAWEEDKAEQEKKEKEKREARAMNHWKLFIKSLLIRERLKERYGKNDPNSASAGTSQQSEKDGRKDTSPVKASWPENKMTAFTGDEGNLLPFEKKTKKKKKR